MPLQASMSAHFDNMSYSYSASDKVGPAQVEITPSSRRTATQTLITAKKRVEKVDPNKGRCLIENCFPKRAVQYAHCYPRRLVEDSLVSALSSKNDVWHV